MTQVSWTKQLALAAFLFVFGSFAYWLEFSHKPQKDAADESAKKLFALKGVAIQSLQLVSQGKTFEFKCTEATGNTCKPGENSKWELAVPMKHKADDSSVNSLVSTLNNLSVPDTISLKDETPEKRTALLHDYGIDESIRNSSAVRKVVIQTAQGKVSAYIGGTHPVGESFFTVREDAKGVVDENTVYLVPSYFGANFSHDLTFWREKKIMTGSEKDFVGFELKGPKAALKGVKKDGQWILQDAKQKNEEFAGDIENIDSFMAGVTALTAKDFLYEKKEEPKAKAMLRGLKPTLVLSLTQLPPKATQPETVVVTMYKKIKPEKILLTVSNLDPLYEVEAFTLNRFDKELKDLRLVKLLTSMERFTTTRMEFSGAPIGTPPLVLTSKDGKWSMDGEKGDLDTEKVQKLLDKLTGNRIQEFLTGAKIPAGEDTALLVSIADDKTNPKRKYAFWKKDSKFYARDLLSKRKEVFAVDTNVRDGLPFDRNFFKKGTAPSK